MQTRNRPGKPGLFCVYGSIAKKMPVTDGEKLREGTSYIFKKLCGRPFERVASGKFSALCPRKLKRRMRRFGQIFIQMANAARRNIGQ
jgi:hypothetical protein